ncbi:MAG: hypothetical protein ABS75_18520 [Pelagibacterium sp. SCN 63-23]|nr:MAG: hypothetical protein ABS75_18520 [Pelagibacterium sp. SCN 63-23]
MTETTLPKIYTLGEAAERLRLNKNALARLARRTGHCAEAGRNLLFSEADLLALWDEMRVEPKAGRTVVRSTLETNTARSLTDWLQSRPPVRVDKRVVGVLRWLASQSAPKTHRDMERAGEKTVAHLLDEGLVDDCGKIESGLIRVRINAEGRKQLSILDKWVSKRKSMPHLRGGTFGWDKL